MIKRILLLFALALPFCARAYDIPVTDSIRWKRTAPWDGWLQPLEPVYLEDAVHVSPWKGNWFFNVSGGVSAFVGSPLGCGDLSDRVRPALAVSAGKWFTPAIGARAVFQGFQFKDAVLDTRDFQHLHADLMWNILSGVHRSGQDLRWSLIPYIGLGILHNDGNGNHPFALSYGLQGRYRLGNRIHLTAEFGSMATFRDFDGLGASDKWGDRMLTWSAGLSVTLGKSGWKRVINAAPYISQNEKLAGYARTLKDENGRLRQRSSKDARIIAELEKILKLEGLLEKYADRLASLSGGRNGRELSEGYPKNDYSGLNSLRARLRNAKRHIGKEAGDTVSVPVRDSLLMSRTADTDAYEKHRHTEHDSIASLVLSDSRYVGPPIYFFFVLNTDRLTDNSQLVNLDGIARIAQRHGLYIQINGAADSATGNAPINADLSRKRAAFIAGQLTKRGVKAGCITTESMGGIDDFSPTEANRNACVRLLLPPPEAAD